MTIDNQPALQPPELLPCPFCGASTFISWDGDVNSPDDWSANCDNTLDCGASIGGMASEGAARKAWNTRSRTSSVSATVNSSEAWHRWFDRLGDVASAEVVNATANLVTDERLVALVDAKVLPAAASPVAPQESTHKWAERVGQHNNDPFWGDVVHNVKAARETVAPQEQSDAAAAEIVKAWLWHTPEHDQVRARRDIATIIKHHFASANVQPSLPTQEVGFDR